MIVNGWKAWKRTRPKTTTMAEEQQGQAQQRSSAWADTVEEAPSTEFLVKHNYLLAIGVDYYADQEIANLSNCVNDMEGLIEVLSTDYWFDAGNIHYLRSRDTDREEDEQARQEKEEAERLERGFAVVAEATHENIIAQMRKLAKKLEPEDNVIIAYSGHGIYDEVFDEGYWMPSDSELANNATYIENSTIRTALNAMKSRHTVLISDSCFSGSLFSSGKQRALGIPRVFKHASRWGLTAGRRNQTVSDGLDGNSPFTSTILDILRRKQEVWIGDLCRELVDSMEGKGEKQTPMGEPLTNLRGHNGGQFVFMPRLASEIDHWFIAWRENTRKAYYNFLARYPDGEYEKMALLALNLFSEGKEPVFSEAHLFTYSFLMERASIDQWSSNSARARFYFKNYLEQVLLGKAGTPMSPDAKETFEFLHSISPLSAEQYCRDFMGDEHMQGRTTFTLAGSSLDAEAIRQTYNFLQAHFPDTTFIKKNGSTKWSLPSGYLTSIWEGDIADTLSTEEITTITAALAENPEPHLRRLIEKRLVFIVDGGEKLPMPIIGKYTDPRDEQSYLTIEIDGQTWFAQNFNYDSSAGISPEEANCWLYRNDPDEEEDGRLYTWDAAVAACPPGCRLPTEQDVKALYEKIEKKWDRDWRYYFSVASGLILRGYWRNGLNKRFKLPHSKHFWLSDPDSEKPDHAQAFSVKKKVYPLPKVHGFPVRYIVESPAG